MRYLALAIKQSAGSVLFRLTGEAATTPAGNYVQVRILKLTRSRFHFIPGELEPRPLGKLLLLGPSG